MVDVPDSSIFSPIIFADEDDSARDLSGTNTPSSLDPELPTLDTEISSIVCNYCRSVHSRCDRRLPSCTRCSKYVYCLPINHPGTLDDSPYVLPTYTDQKVDVELFATTEQ